MKNVSVCVEEKTKRTFHTYKIDRGWDLNFLSFLRITKLFDARFSLLFWGLCIEFWFVWFVHPQKTLIFSEYNKGMSRALSCVRNMYERLNP